MRAHNAQQVLKSVRRSGPVSRADLSRSTSLSAPTISALIDSMLRAGLVEEHGEGDSSGGRRPQLIRFNSRWGVVVGVVIATTTVQFAVADMDGHILRKETVALAADTRPKAVMRRIAASIKTLLKGISDRVLGVAVGAPGMTDVERGVVLEAANLDGWQEVPVREMLGQLLGVPVAVDNDVNLAALGEQRAGCARGVRNFVFISLGTGIGAGVVIENQLLRGQRWHAGEISHLNVDFREWDTDFAAAGYLESYVGATPRTRAKRAPRRSSGTLDDEAVLRLGAAVANIATILDPELIVFGGRVALAAPPEILERVWEVAARIAPNCPDFQLTQLGEEASLHGSAHLALTFANETLRELLEQPSAVA